jgi:ApbE superfamily uncharacterized protein (UPF0280 family)
MRHPYQKRTYRNLVQCKHLTSFQVVVKETDLFVHADRNLKRITQELILKYRGYIENYIKRHADYGRSLHPWKPDTLAPKIVNDMAKSGAKAGVGPMAAVAGAIAEYVGIDLLSHSEEIIVENGGDIFLKTNNPLTIGIFAGQSPLNMKLGIKIDCRNAPSAICTSSGTIGHSLSFGSADAVCVISNSCSLADAAATAIANLVHGKDDVDKAIEVGKQIEGVRALAVIIGSDIGLWGDLEVVPLKTKKG